MVAIKSDNKEVQKALEKLATIVTAKGGFLSEHLTIEVHDGNIRLLSDLPPSSHERLVLIPEHCFIPLTNVAFRLSENKLETVSGTDTLTPDQAELLAVMIEIYNLTDKILKYRTYSPRIVFRDDDETLSRLISGRPDTGLEKRFMEVKKTSDMESLVINSYFRTRNFRIAGEKRQLIPFIDFANHHTLASTFKNDLIGKTAISRALYNSKPQPGSEECFARYGFWDALETYLMFGFSDTPVAFVRSVPLHIILEEVGIIEVKSQVRGPATGKGLGPKNKDLRSSFPFWVKKKGKTLFVSNLMIPNLSAPSALNQVLGLLVSQLDPDLADNRKQKLVLAAEKQIISVNLDFYNDLYNYLLKVTPDYPDSPALEMAIRMATIQLEAIDLYQKAQID